MTLISIDEAATRLSMSYGTVRRLVTTGKIAGVCYGTPGRRGVVWEADDEGVEQYRLTSRLSELERAWETTLAQLAPDLLDQGTWFVAFDPERAWRLDWGIPALRVAVELHGAEFINGRHTRGRGFIEDRHKMNAAQLAGWIVLEFTTTMLQRDPAACVAQVITALRQRSVTKPRASQPSAALTEKLV